MSITVKHQNRKTNLTDQERQQLALLLGEARSRGLDVAMGIDIVTRYKWPIDSRGYFTKLDGSQYIPTEDQDDFIDSTSRFSGFFGSRGSGKSAAGAQKALKKIMQGESGMACNPDLENFKLSTWPEFREWIPWEMVVPSHKYRMNPEWQPQQPFTLVFNNKAKVYCKGIKDPDSARGPNINWLWYDEGCRDLEGLSWQIAIASVRVGNNPQAWTTTTPKGKYHWAHEFFVEKEIPPEVLEILEKIGREDEELIEWFHGTIKENEENLDPLFFASILLAYPKGYLRKQEVEGLFVSPEGALGDRTWFDGKVIPAVPKDVVIKARVRYWDLAASEKKLTGKKKTDPDKTVGTLMSWDGTNFYIEDQTSGYWEWKKIKESLYETALEDGIHIPIYIEQEPAAGGKNQVAELKSYIKEKIPVFKMEGHLPKEAGDKVMRAQTWFAEAAAGLMYLVYGDWNEDFLGELDNFPEARHDDHVDSASGARHTVAPVRTWKKMPFLSLKMIMNEEKKNENDKKN
jgi:predicted phage terminase large subunit-like protein